MPQISHRHNSGVIDMLQTDKGFQNIPHEEISDDDLLNNQSGITGQMDRLNRIMASRLRQTFVEQSDRLIESIRIFNETSTALSNRIRRLNIWLVVLTVVLVFFTGILVHYQVGFFDLLGGVR